MSIRPRKKRVIREVEEIIGNPDANFRNNYPSTPQVTSISAPINGSIQVIADNLASLKREVDNIGAGVIDGDKLQLTFTPTTYTPDSSIPEADTDQDLAAHLNGLDQYLRKLRVKEHFTFNTAFPLGLITLETNDIIRVAGIMINTVFSPGTQFSVGFTGDEEAVLEKTDSLPQVAGLYEVDAHYLVTGTKEIKLYSYGSPIAGNGIVILEGV